MASNSQLIMQAVKKALAASKTYTNEVVVGGGAIKGKNCVVDSITDITGGHRVTFKWTLDNGTVQTGTMDVMDGADGQDGDKGDTGLGIKSTHIDTSNHLIITYDDDTTEDAGEISVTVATELSDLSDIDFDNLSDGQVLKYNATTQKWVNASGQTVDTKLVDLNDVDISNVQDGQIIVWDANTNRWVNTSLSIDLDDIADVVITSPSDGQSLVYDATSQQWINGTSALSIEELGDIPDVDLDNLQDGQTIVWDATNNKWVNGATSTVAGLDDLTDVTLTSPTAGQILAFDDSDSEWKNTDAPTIPTKVSELQNDAGYVVGTSLATVATTGDYADLQNTPTKVSDFTNDAGYVVGTSLADIATSGDFSDLQNTPTTASGYGITDVYTKTEVDDEIDKAAARAYKPAGDATLMTLPALTEENLGKVYHMTADFTTTADFKEGAGKEVKAGNDVGIVEVMVGTTATYMYNVLGGFVDLSGYQPLLTPGANISIDTSGEISATDTIYTAGDNINIDANNEISAIDTQYTPGRGVNIDSSNEISANTNIFNGSTDDWESLSLAEKLQYTNAAIDDDNSAITIDANPTQSSGNAVSSGGVFSGLAGKADKVSSATNGNFAGLDASGNLMDSGKKASDFATAQGLENEVVTRATLGAHNLLNIFNSEINVSGTYTEVVNSDGTVTIGGTPTSACTIPYKATALYNDSVYNLEPSTNYVLDSGLSAISPLYIQVFTKANSSASWTKIAETTSNTSLSFTTPSSFYDVWARILVPANAVVPANTVVKPQIRLATDAYSEYTPYVPTNAELLSADTNVELGAHQFLNYSLAGLKALNTSGSWNNNTYTLNGVSFTINNDLSISTSGTASVYTELIIINRISSNYKIPKNVYSFNGVPKSNGVAIFINHTESGSGVVDGIDRGDGFVFTKTDETAPMGVILAVNANTNTNGLTFKPLLKLASDPSTKYVPYAMTNRELTNTTNTNAKNISAINKGTLDLDAIELTANTPNKVISSYGVYLITFNHGGGAPGGLYLVQVHATDPNGMQVAVIKESTDRTVSFDLSTVNQLTVTASGNGRMRIIKLDASNY